MISLIVALSEPTYAIGKDNDLLWNIPDDMKHFKRITEGSAVIMGRRTWDSIPEKFRPLPGRKNIVLSRHLSKAGDGAITCCNLDLALDAAGPEDSTFIIGGSAVYTEALQRNLVDTMYITLVNQVVDGDAYFPRFDKSQWNELFLGQGEHKQWSYRFMHYRRKVDVVPLSS